MGVQRKRRADSIPTRGFPADRCSRCHEATVGVRKCKCQSGGMPRGKVWINGILRFIDGCPNCGSTLHTGCTRKTVAPGGNV